MENQLYVRQMEVDQASSEEDDRKPETDFLE